MTLFSKAWKWLDNLFFGSRRRREAILSKIAEGVRAIEISMDLQTESIITIIDTTKSVLSAASMNLSAAQQALVRAMGAFERSDMAFAEIGAMADKMKGREAALEEALISIGKLKVEEAKVKGLEAEELKLNLAAKPYDDKF